MEISEIKSHPNNTATFRDLAGEEFEDLKASIRDHGIIEPVVINQHGVIICGHQRVRACREIGITDVPVVVREVASDEEHETLLIEENLRRRQLLPSESFKAVKRLYELRGIDGAGSRGDLTGATVAQVAAELGKSERTVKTMRTLAELIGKSSAYISQVRGAAEVFVKLSQLNLMKGEELSRFIGKAQHLNEIHKAPATLWPILVSALLAKEWSVKDTKHFVGKVLEFEVPETWQAVFLPLPMIISRYLERLEFSPKTVSKLIETAESIESRVKTYKTSTSEIIAEFRQWLSDHAGAESCASIGPGSESLSRTLHV